MGRKYIDCRDYPGDHNCSVALSADSKEELLEAVIQHATTVHSYEDTKEFRDMILRDMKDGSPPA
jgi:predicted small metal-binding protein